MDLLQQQDELQKEGNALLDGLGLLTFLSKFGTPEVVGSMASGLMVWRDIDIEIVKNELNETEYWETVKFLFEIKNLYHSLYVQDFRKSINPNTPKGLYVGTKVEYQGSTWKIDVWFMPPRTKDSINYNEWIKDKLNSENKKIILELKEQINGSPKYRKEVFSVDIYKAVIENGVKNLVEFKEYLAKQHISLE